MKRLLVLGLPLALAACGPDPGSPEDQQLNAAAAALDLDAAAPQENAQ